MADAEDDLDLDSTARPERDRRAVVLAYLYGGAGILSGAFYVLVEPASGALFWVAGVLVFPPTRRFYESRFGVRLDRWARLGVFVVLWVAGIALLPSRPGIP